MRALPFYYADRALSWFLHATKTDICHAVAAFRRPIIHDITSLLSEQRKETEQKACMLLWDSLSQDTFLSIDTNRSFPSRILSYMLLSLFSLLFLFFSRTTHHFYILFPERVWYSDEPRESFSRWKNKSFSFLFCQNTERVFKERYWHETLETIVLS